jgi:transposase
LVKQQYASLRPPLERQHEVRNNPLGIILDPALWKKLTRFLEYPQLELSNNLAEYSMRPVALGRKNWVHIGSEQAGPRVAAILSVVESCRRLKIPVRDYLGTILPGLANTPIQRVPELTPTAWIHSQTQA